ncbi:hypothetical protein [Variovorax sp. JS1663]|uniref:hypothetical protein n=1 Tax=Variovorax sp. JS1663 TaxID=1851577 RepID=UPI000B345D8C|nr:hypothetical protein [Variovorax sp. JS1663]OUM00374.1 hypothetical protein A8M77_21190 [Variovorax sp. JS1663]
MARPECLQRWRALFGVALFLCLALLGVGARASIPGMQHAGPVAISVMVSESMQTVADCMPCARCYVAPAPVTQGFSGEGKTPDEPFWRVRSPSVPDTEYFETGGRHVGLPVSILYCRWLN